MHILLKALLVVLRALVLPRAVLTVENAALRQQLAVYLRTAKRPQLQRADRAFWVLLQKVWPGWSRSPVGDGGVAIVIACQQSRPRRWQPRPIPPVYPDSAAASVPVWSGVMDFR